MFKQLFICVFLDTVCTNWLKSFGIFYELSQK